MSAITWTGSGRAARRKKPRPSADLVRALELHVFLAQSGKLLPLGCGEQIVPLAGIGLGLPDPAPQGLVVDAELLGEATDHRLRIGRAIHPDRTLTQLQWVLPGRRHRQISSHEIHLTCSHPSSHLGGTSLCRMCGKHQTVLTRRRLRQAPPLSTEGARRHLYRLVEAELSNGGS
jgi:hypothetical protein